MKQFPITSPKRLYHYLLAKIAPWRYGHPSRKVKIVGITGTKGKTTTAELINALLEKAGYKTALAGTLRFKVGSRSKRNLLKMTMPGRFFMQRFLSEAAEEGCDWVVLEMTSAGAEQYRHLGIELDAFVFLNLQPEHLEFHGSLERYRHAKRLLATALEESSKPSRILVLNRDTDESKLYRDVEAEVKVTYSLEDAEPYTLREDGVDFKLADLDVHSPLVGEFNLSNMLAAAAFGAAIGIDLETIKAALESFRGVRGRAEYVREGQRFDVVVDYAHTPDSLKAIYGTAGEKKIIAVLGNAGGGRDKWKRGEMAAIADQLAEKIFLTNEDPYDENPRAIVEEMQRAIEETELEIIMDRRKAIRKALEAAEEMSKSGEEVVVMLTGKGTDPYIMGPKGTKTPWDEVKVAKEELRKLINRDVVQTLTEHSL